MNFIAYIILAILFQLSIIFAQSDRYIKHYTNIGKSATDEWQNSSMPDSVWEAWVSHYGSGLAPSTDKASDVVIDDHGNVYVTGWSDSSVYFGDYVTIKYNSLGVVQWISRYNGPGNNLDRATALVVDAHGNVYVTGSSEGLGTGSDYATIKYNSSGAEQWVVRYNGPENGSDRTTSMTIDVQGNVFVTGRSGSSDYATVKYNSSGVKQWVTRYNGQGISSGEAAALAVDYNGNIYVTGYSYGSVSGRDYVSIKYNSSGVEQWIVRYNGPGNSWDEASSLALDSQGNVYVTGYSYGTVSDQDYATIKYNSSGVKQWIARYNGPVNSSDIASALAVDGQGNVYVTGRSQGADSSSDYTTIKYDSSGIEQWVTRYNGLSNNYDRANALILDDWGNIYVTGSSGIYNFYDYATVKYNSSGIEQWVIRYDGTGNGLDEANGLAVDDQGNVYVTGHSGGLGTNSDFSTVKYDSSGIEQWVMRYNGPGINRDRATAQALDNQGNVYITGYSEGAGTSNDYATIKYNSLGVKQWIARYNGPDNSNDRSTEVVVDSQGNVYVAGYSYGNGTHKDYTTIKYNSLGVEQWVARYNGPGDSSDVATSLAIDAQSNVYVTGYSIGAGTLKDYATIKYNSLGVEQWVVRYNSPVSGNDDATAMGIDTYGNVYVTGQGATNHYFDYTTIKYNAAGVEQWVQLYNGPGNRWDVAKALEVDAQGNVYVSGYSFGSGTSEDYATVKYDSSGVEQWVARYNSFENGQDMAAALAVDTQGNVYVTGQGATNHYFDYTTIKYNPAGVEQWVMHYNGPDNDWDVATMLAVDSQGNVYVTGNSGYLWYHMGRYGLVCDYATIKYNSSGIQQWVTRYDRPINSNDGLPVLSVDDQNNVFLTGTSTNGGSIFTTIKYSQFLTGFKQETVNLPKKYKLKQNYPNPFNPTTTIEFSIPKAEFVNLKIYNMIGQEVATLVSDKLTLGNYTYTWDAGSLASGVYIYKIQAGTHQQIRKMVYLK